MSEKEPRERIEQLEKTIFALALAAGRLDVLQHAGYEVALKKAEIQHEQEDE